MLLIFGQDFRANDSCSPYMRYVLQRLYKSPNSAAAKARTQYMNKQRMMLQVWFVFLNLLGFTFFMVVN